MPFLILNSKFEIQNSPDNRHTSRLAVILILGAVALFTAVSALPLTRSFETPLQQQ